MCSRPSKRCSSVPTATEAFFAFAFPSPDGFDQATLAPAAARWDTELGEYLLDWDDYEAFNAAYAAWFSDRLPSRTCVGVTGLAAGARVEIDWVCWRSGGWGTTIDL